MLKVARLLLFMWFVRHPQVLGCMVFKWLHLSWTKRQQAVIHHMTANEMSYALSCFMRYVEVKMAPIDAIWLFLVLTFIALSHYFMAPISPTLHPDRSVYGIGYASNKYL